MNDSNTTCDNCPASPGEIAASFFSALLSLVVIVETISIGILIARLKGIKV